MSEILKSTIPEYLQSHKAFDEEDTNVRILRDSILLEESQSTGRISHLQEIIRLEGIRREINSYSQQISTELKNLVTENDCTDEFSTGRKASDYDNRLSLSIDWHADENESKSYDFSERSNNNLCKDYSNISENPPILHSSNSSSSESSDFLGRTNKLTSQTKIIGSKQNCCKRFFACIFQQNL